MRNYHDEIDEIRRLDPIDGTRLTDSWSDSDAKRVLFQEITARQANPVPQDAFEGLGRSPEAQETLTAILQSAPEKQPVSAPTARSVRPRIAPRLQVGFAAAAALLLVAVGTVILVPGGATTAEAKVREAAAALGETESLRATMEQVYPNGDVWTFTGEFQGADGKQMGTQVSADGTRSEWEIIMIGDTEWMVAGEHVSSEHRTPGERLSPFAEASSAVVSAVLEGGDVEEVGTENGDGAESTHYRITPDARSRAALAQLKPGELAWFSLDLEAPAAVDFIDVWVADEIIHRIDIRFAQDFFLVSTTNRYFDFGANVVISPPPD